MEKEKKHIFDEKIKGILLGYEEDAPVYSYVTFQKRKDVNGRGSSAIFYAAASVVLLLSFGVGYFTRYADTEKDLVMAVRQKALLQEFRSDFGSFFASDPTVYTLADGVEEDVVRSSYEQASEMPSKAGFDKYSSRVMNSASSKVLAFAESSDKKGSHLDANEDNEEEYCDEEPNTGIGLLSTLAGDSCNDKVAYGTGVMDANVPEGIAIREKVELSDSLHQISLRDSLRLLYKYLSMVKVEEASKKCSEITSDVVVNEYSADRVLKEARGSSWIVGGEVLSMLGQYSEQVGAGEMPKQKNLKTSKEGVDAVDEELKIVTEEKRTTTVTYATSLSVKKIVSNRFIIRSGINFNQLTIAKKQVDYVELPLMVEYKLIDNRLSVSLNNGVCAGFQEENTVPVGVTGVIFQYPLTKKVHVNVEPTYKHIFGDKWGYNSNFYGVTAGLNYMF